MRWCHRVLPRASRGRARHLQRVTRRVQDTRTHTDLRDRTVTIDRELAAHRQARIDGLHVPGSRARVQRIVYSHVLSPYQ